MRSPPKGHLRLHHGVSRGNRTSGPTQPPRVAGLQTDMSATSPSERAADPAKPHALDSVGAARYSRPPFVGRRVLYRHVSERQVLQNVQDRGSPSLIEHPAWPLELARGVVSIELDSKQHSEAPPEAIRARPTPSTSQDRTNRSGAAPRSCPWTVGMPR